MKVRAVAVAVLTSVLALGAAACVPPMEPAPTTTSTTTTTTTVPAVPKAVAISAGGMHSCALTPAGGVECWGDNEYGQLGDGTTTDSTTPVKVTGLSSGVVAIDNGFYFSCALTGAGGVKCWGNNEYGQLGDGTLTNRTTPVNVTGLNSGVAEVLATSALACVRTTTGGVKCWGVNAYGTLGDGTTTNRPSPVNVIGLSSGVTAISGGAGGAHVCALTTSGGAKCWGYNGSGQLGDGTLTDRFTPVNVTGLSAGVTSLAPGGFHTCAIASGGAVKCWGSGQPGSLGNGLYADSSTPVDVVGLNGVTSLTSGDYHSCAITAAGAVMCWGANHNLGALGNGSGQNSAVPVLADYMFAPVHLTSGVVSVSGGFAHALALTGTGEVKSWGRNYEGQLGNGTTSPMYWPGPVTGFSS